MDEKSTITVENTIMVEKNTIKHEKSTILDVA